MAQVNPLTRELLVKLVYYGPGLGGKTSSLQRIHASSPPETRGQIVSLATPVDRTLYFDFLPLRAQSLRGHHVRLQLFTVPGQVYFNATRKLVLTGADGIVFVADSQRERHDANLESLENLAANLEDQGRSLAQIPLVFQYNKRDLPKAMSMAEMDESLNALGAPSFGTNAARGEHVLEALDALVRAVLDDLEARNVLGAPVVPTPEPRFARTEEALEEQIGRASAEFFVSPDGELSPRRPEVSVLRAIPELLVEPATEAVDASEGESPARKSLRPTVAPVPAREGSSGPSFASLFSGDEVEVLGIEAEIAAGHFAEAVSRCDSVAWRILSRLGDEVGVSDGVLCIPFLGVDSARFLSFRRAAQRASGLGTVDARDALETFALLLEIRLRANRLGEGPDSR